MSRGFLTHVTPTVLYVLAIFWLGASHVSIQIPHAFFAEDKISHFTAFGLLVLLLLRTLRYEYPAAGNGRLVGASVAVSSFIGALLEFWQYLFPYRSLELADWIADTLGASLVGLLLMLWFRWRRSRTSSMRPANSAG
jgi:VanZ family protein